MPATEPDPNSGLVELAVHGLSGELLSPPDLVKLQDALRSISEGMNECHLPGLRAPLRGADAATSLRDLVLWALLVGARSPPEEAVSQAQEVVREVWSARRAPPLLTDGTARRVMSVPLVLLQPRSRESTPSEPPSPETWRDLTMRCLAWFQGRLQLAKGRDELANWVLARLPPVWLLPDRPAAGPEASGGGVGLADQVDRWLPPSDLEAYRRPSRGPKRTGDARP